MRRHVERAPNAVAIVSPDRAPLTYRRLWTQIADVAAALRAGGFGPADRVAIVLPDGPEMAVAFLAVSAVSTAAPLNPAYRRNEVEARLTGLHVKALITNDEASPAAVAALRIGARVVRLVPDLSAPAGVFGLADVPLAPHASLPLPRGGDAALVLTTSGTTSRPKVVALTHANLCASALNIAARLELRADDRCLDVMPLFHVHGLIGGVLSSLAAGSSVVCPPGFDAPRFFDWIDALEPTWYTAVPTMHQAILARASAHGRVVARRSIHFIRSASSALPGPVRTALEAAFQAPVIEAYGMTEGSHQVASNPLPPGVRKAGSVGLTSGAEAAIMDARGQLLPHGSTGEIVIRGATVMTGYEADPAANAHAFVDGWLRTGDAGHFDEDSYLFITGRLTETINRAGEKIAPLEVDDVLLSHPAVAEAATFALPHETLGHEVASAIVLRPAIACAERELREFVAATLAPFKVPSRIFLVDRIPKSATGKLQRHLLASQLGLAADDASRAAAPVPAPPCSPLERTLAAIWQEVLGVAPEGIHDNFFDLGGDSVLAARVVARVSGELNADLSLVTLFERPTLASMADVISAAIADRAAAREPAKNPGTRRPTISPVGREAFRTRRTRLADAVKTPETPPSFGQQRLWFIDQWQPDSGMFNSRVPIRLTGSLQIAAIEQSLAAIVRRHDVLRASFPSKGGQPVQRIAPALRVPLPVIDLGGLPECDRAPELDRLIRDEARRPFDLSSGPLIRTSLIRIDPDNHVLLVTVHHIVFDGWSRAILLRELA
ncbi:MAG TPA: AMP-binding protein, partial [Vicinamibacterales bacterium]|nr:AMP-binding protein [Vicinamibacterales bacterium]